MREEVFLIHEWNRFAAQLDDQVVDQAARLAGEVQNHAAHDDHGDEVRRVGDGLDHFPVSLMAEGVQHQCQDDRNRE